MTALQVPPATEAAERFQCFGGSCAVLLQGAGPAGSPEQAAARVRRRLEQWHHQFSRFEPSSELSRFNADPRPAVRVSPMLARFVEAAVSGAALTKGLVDPTLVTEVEKAGYAESLTGDSLALGRLLELAPHRRAAQPNPRSRWREIQVDRWTRTVTRPPGLRLDSGGIAKGLFGDVLAELLDFHFRFAIDAAGDLRFGGSCCLPRQVKVASPFDHSVLHSFELVAGAAATSGVSKRSWLDAHGHPGHHLLDPATGRPAFTGIVQATALAPTAVEAEARSKAALLSGPERAGSWLTHGGLVVYDDGRSTVIEPAAAVELGCPAR